MVIKDGLRNRTLRCRVESDGLDISSMIIKQIKEELARGFSDWASLEFLSGLPEAEGIAPRFYGGDVAARFFLVEDLGEGTNVHDLLSGNDRAAARAGLQELAIQMARLHTASLGKEERFEAVRARLPEANGLGRQQEARQWLSNRGKIVDWFHALGCVPSAGLEADMEWIADIYSKDNGFLAFSHGDPAPSNNLYVKTRAFLLDFEYGGFRHALYDITAWAILCPLPLDCVREMRLCFRTELAKACPAARDEARFERGWAALCAYRALAMLTWIPPDIIRENRIWAESWTMREAVFVAMSRLEEATEPFAELEAIGKAAGVLAKAMHERWPEFKENEAVIPQWNAFKENS
ncbi:MAG: hypothetical protein WCD79_22660 [Chthoniobacteraceae bacterium]